MKAGRHGKELKKFSIEYLCIHGEVVRDETVEIIMGQILNGMHTMERSMKSNPMIMESQSRVLIKTMRLCPHKIYILEWKIDCKIHDQRLLQVRSNSLWVTSKFI